MGKYNHINYAKLNTFIDHLLDAQWKQFQAIIHEGQLVTSTVLQTTLDAAETAARLVSTVVAM